MGGLPSSLNTLMQSKWFVDLNKAHTRRPARWILINLPYINCMLSGFTELKAEYKGSFCLGEWNKGLLRALAAGVSRHGAATTGVPNTFQNISPWTAHPWGFSLILHNTAKFRAQGISDDQAERCHLFPESLGQMNSSCKSHPCQL